MGQSNSKLHEPSTRPVLPAPSSSTTPVAGASTDPQPVPSVDVDTHNSDVSGSQRSSVRKSILKLVKPSNIRSRLSSVASNPGDVGRSWRNSRRWSKAPLDCTAQPLEQQLASSSTSFIDAPPNSSSPLDKGKQREIPSPLDEDEDSHDTTVRNVDQATRLANAIPVPEPTANAVTPTLDVVTGSFADLQTTAIDAAHDGQMSDDPELESPPIQSPSPVYERGRNETTSSPEPQPSLTSQQSTPLPPRQFPPPGTLVVVQGIVHTTDVSRTGSPQHGEPLSPNTRATAVLDPSPEQGTNRSRNRLSTLLRPRSTSSRPSSASVGDSAPTVVVTAPAETESVPAFVSESSESSTDESTQTRATTPTLNEPVNSHRDDPIPLTDGSPVITDSRVPSISSSSIDVLGTLLSVAAAATAASLLTGSSEPILSSGLAPPNPNTSVPSSAHHISTASPSTASLPNLPTHPRSLTPNAVNPDISAAGRAERMRQAWGTIRERLGLRPSVSPPDPGTRNIFQDGNGDSLLPTGSDGDAETSGAPTDTRELMLAEMARAFNIGLGLNGLGGSTPTTNANNAPADREAVGIPDTSSNETAESPRNDSASHSQSGPVTGAASVTMPPEGSFERFLVDLQIDLRAALTQAEDNVDTTQGQMQISQPQPQGPLPTSILPTDPDSIEPPLITVSSPPVLSEGHDQHPLSRLEILESQPGNMGVQDAGDDFDPNMPSLQAVSDSESEFDEEDLDDEDDDFHSAVHEMDAGQHGSPNDENRPRTSGTGRIDASGRINWWRLYRFPPIISPRMDMAALRQPFVSTPMSTSPTPTPTSLSTPSQTLLSAENLPINTTLSDPSSSDTPAPASTPIPQQSFAQGSAQAGGTQVPLHAVVPVIVVGLQSVNQEWRPEMPPQGENDGIDFFGQPPSEEAEVDNLVNDHGDDDDLDAWGGQQPTGQDGARGRGRARGWHARAANAIRNLRPGRRNAEVGTGPQPPLVVPGSRTFLIYVIGGYYPPDHSIVTGGPNILDSFEALLELADLLGQVKPPTVSKDDIEKSGLKIIKASELVQHEKAGNVASNCLDRCLICLDDYEPEDQIRVMSCRHAFHKGCVDEWLQKGRNNCPACRSTGVTTDTHPSPVTPVPAS